LFLHIGGLLATTFVFVIRPMW